MPRAGCMVKQSRDILCSRMLKLGQAMYTTSRCRISTAVVVCTGMAAAGRRRHTSGNSGILCVRVDPYCCVARRIWEGEWLC